MQEQVDPPLDVELRLRAIGLWPSGLNPQCPIEHGSLWDWQVCPQCGDVHEPQMVVPKVSKGPQGNPKGYGRGPLTDEDARRLKFFCYIVR